MYYRRNAKTGQLNPRQQTFAEDLNCTVWTIQRHMQTLCQAGMVRAIKGRRSSSYEIRPEVEWRSLPRCRNVAKQLSLPLVASNSTAVQMPGLNGPVLTEVETSLSERKTDAAAKACGLIGDPDFGDGGGGGGVPAAPKTKTPEKAESTPEARPVPAPKPIVPPVRPPKPPQPPKKAPPAPPPPAPRRSEHGHHAPSEVSARAEEIAEGLAKAHPVTGSFKAACQAVERALEKHGDVGDELQESHRRFLIVWASYEKGRFVPQLWRWVEEGDWRFPPEKEKADEMAKQAAEDAAKAEIKAKIRAEIAEMEAAEERENAKYRLPGRSW